MGPYTLSSPGVVLMQDGQSTGTGLALVPEGKCARATIVLQGSTTTGAITTGVVTIEESYYAAGGPVYAGTWSTITTVNASTLTTGAQAVIHVAGSVWAVRARISTATSTGSITAYGWSN